MSTRQQVVGLQKAILRTIERKIDEHLGEAPRKLKALRKDYHRAVARYRSVSTKEELLKEVLRSDIVLCGDFHTLAQAQRTHLRILREIVARRIQASPNPAIKAGGGALPGTRDTESRSPAHPGQATNMRPALKLVIGIEMIPACEQVHLDDYLAGKIEEDEFLEIINYEGVWGFPWENYRPLLELARQYDIPVRALNLSSGPGGLYPSINAREGFVARQIAQTAVHFENHLIYVVFGDLHLAPGHLPLKLRRKLKKLRMAQKRILVIYQNATSLYWQLAREGLADKIDVVKLNDDAFCVIGVPPWVKLQSYLDWLENSDRTLCCDEDDDEDAEPAHSEKSFQRRLAGSYSEQIYSIACEIARFLELSTDELDSFRFYCLDDVDFLEKIIARKKDEPELFQLLSQSNCLFFPDERVIFLSTVDINHAAEGAAEFLHFVRSGYSPAPKPPREAFYFRTLRKALGYFGSMLLNHKRKCWYFRDHHIFVDSLSRRRLDDATATRRLVSKMVLRLQAAEDAYIKGEKSRLWLPSVYSFDCKTGYAVSKALGYIMGDKLYKGLFQHVVSKEDIMKLFCNPFDTPGSALKTYIYWRAELKKVMKFFTSKEQFF